MKKLQIKYLIMAVVLTAFLFPFKVSAHSGRTDSSGGHNCNVGSCAGTYHYHNGGYTPPIVEQPPAPVITQRNPYIPKPSPTSVIIQTIPSSVPIPIPTPKPTPTPSPTPSPIPSSSPIPTLSPQVLGKETDSKSSGGELLIAGLLGLVAMGLFGLVAAGLLGHKAWRAIKQKWPFHSE